MDIRERQRPLKEKYRSDPNSATITLKATGTEGEVPMACSVEVGHAIHDAQAHKGAGGAGTAACSGDMLLGALAACAQVTCQMVAAAMGIETSRIGVEVEGDLDLKGTLGIHLETPVGFQAIRLRLHVDGPDLDAEQLESLREKTTRYCVVLSTLREPPPVEVTWTA